MKISKHWPYALILLFVIGVSVSGEVIKIQERLNGANEQRAPAEIDKRRRWRQWDDFDE